MPIEATVVLSVLGLALAYYFRREILLVLLMVGVLTGLVFIWGGEIQSVWLKGGMSLALFLVVGMLIQKLGLDRNARAAHASSGGQGGGSGSDATCSTCLGTGRTHCYACSGSGQGPGGMGNALGKSVSCFHCSGSGTIRCSCRS
jgi:uncharacterized membrane protein (UPF0136 family)